MKPRDASDKLTSQTNGKSAGLPNLRSFDPVIFADFFTLMGPTEATHWIERFCDALMDESLKPHDADRSRADIHQTSARAGLIGLNALHAACLSYLEVGPGQGSPDTAYQRVCAEMKRALVEIEPHLAALRQVHGS